MFTVEDAIRIARQAHQGQVDKAGKPYIGHPMRVMRSVTGTHEKMTAVLHDVVEDTDVTAADLVAAGCPPEVIEAVVAITKVPGEPQEKYLARVAANPIALAVKLADIADNSSDERLLHLDEFTQRRLRAKYTAALAFLGAY
jgi:(p)ppGpp synthase/HD superfamily hydrolase